MSVNVLMPQGTSVPSTKLDTVNKLIHIFFPVTASNNLEGMEGLKNSVFVEHVVANYETGEEIKRKQYPITMGLVAQATLVYDPVAEEVIVKANGYHVLDTNTEELSKGEYEHAIRYDALVAQTCGEDTKNIGVIDNRPHAEFEVNFVRDREFSKVKDAAGIEKAYDLIFDKFNGIRFSYLGKVEHKKLGTAELFFCGLMRSIIYIVNGVAKRLKLDEYDNANMATNDTLVLYKKTRNDKFRIVSLNLSDIENAINGNEKIIGRLLKKSVQVTVNLQAFTTLNSEHKILFLTEDATGVKTLSYIDPETLGFGMVSEVNPAVLDGPLIIVHDSGKYHAVSFKK